MRDKTIEFEAVETDLKYKDEPVYKVRKVIQKGKWTHKQSTFDDLCIKYKNHKGEECYRKIYY